LRSRSPGAAAVAVTVPVHIDRAERLPRSAIAGADAPVGQ
jgi:hypothetical protein